MTIKFDADPERLLPHVLRAPAQIEEKRRLIWSVTAPVFTDWVNLWLATDAGSSHYHLPVSRIFRFRRFTSPINLRGTREATGRPQELPV
jgi:hypothetical protein